MESLFFFVLVNRRLKRCSRTYCYHNCWLYHYQEMPRMTRTRTMMTSRNHGTKWITWNLWNCGVLLGTCTSVQWVTEALSFRAEDAHFGEEKFSCFPQGPELFSINAYLELKRCYRSLKNAGCSPFLSRQPTTNRNKHLVKTLFQNLLFEIRKTSLF